MSSQLEMTRFLYFKHSRIGPDDNGRTCIAVFGRDELHIDLF